MISIEKLKEKAYFNIEDSNDFYEGYHIENERWNGWATPAFSKNVANVIAHNFSALNFEISYEEERDCYKVVITMDKMETEIAIAEKKIINTVDGEKEVYDFSVFGWTWDDYTIDDVEENEEANIIRDSSKKQIDKENSINMDY